ncbi:unnamed protein product [Prorocentrum cordatum]|uniref:Protochlorophyllide reductase n=1 Tax=Prorocentrum cordatum TaxID=2364126 RepID=A0ABN9SX33_9DINO|nr:unnamed protein product [Polarella glacialis]
MARERILSRSSARRVPAAAADGGADGPARGTRLSPGAVPRAVDLEKSPPHALAGRARAAAACRQRRLEQRRRGGGMGAYPRRGCGCCAAWAAVPLAALLGAPLWLREVSVLRVGRGLEECSSLGGTNLVITGSTSGIGLEAARHAVSLGAQVVVSGPDQARTKRAAKEVQGDAFRGRAVPIAMDLGDFDDVHRFAAEVSAAMPVVQMLYLNAGIAYANFATEWSMRAVHSKRDADFVSKSGHDRVMATNHLGHFLLTVLLAPVLAPGASIVVMGSHGMWHCGFGRLMPDDRPKWEAREGAQLVQRKNAAIAYLDSKLANRCFVGALRRKSAELGLEGARVVLHDPGMVLSSMARHRGSKDTAAGETYGLSPSSPPSLSLSL